MFQKFKYYLLKNRIMDNEIREIFQKLTENTYKTWESQYFNDLNNIVNTKYKDFDKIGYSKFFMLSHPEVWIFFIKDEDFLNYISLFWNDVLNLFLKNQNINKTINKVEEEEFFEEECRKFKYIIKVLNETNPDKFPIINFQI